MFVNVSDQNPGSQMCRKEVWFNKSADIRRRWTRKEGGIKQLGGIRVEIGGRDDVCVFVSDPYQESTRVSRR